jgi:GxxExxY protein
MENEVELLFKDEVYAIVGGAIEVHRELGPGFLEAVYQEALELELAWREIPFEAKKRLRIAYKHATLKKEYEADFLVYGEIIVEIKAQNKLTSLDESQLLNYLKATGKRVGLLINFGSEGKLEWLRRVR